MIDEGMSVCLLLWLIVVVTCTLLVIAAIGCGGSGQGASTDIVAGEGAIVDATTDLAEDESTVDADTVGGDVSTVRFGMDEGTTKVATKRVAQEAAHRATEKVMFAGVVIVLLAFAKVLPGWAFIAGISAIAGGPILSLVLVQVF